jgi:uncharacterized protein (DUF1778 family)
MPPKKDRGSKTETLSLRLDPKTKFILEFVARINGQTLTTIVERAIRASCDQVKIETMFGVTQNWQHFWDPEEGVRTLRLLASDGYQSTYDEDDLRSFTETHWEFFYTSEELLTPKRSFVEVLWPKIDEYRQIWRQQRESDYWAAGRTMAEDLGKAQLKAPLWPRPASPPQSQKPAVALPGRS